VTYDVSSEASDLTSPSHTNPNPNGLFGIAALMLDYNDSSDIDITAKSHYSYYQLTTHNSSEKNN